MHEAVRPLSSLPRDEGDVRGGHSISRAHLAPEIFWAACNGQKFDRR